MIAIPAPMQAPEQLFKPFTSEDWIYELKFDGYRCMAGVEKRTAPIRTRLQLATEAALRVRLLTKAGRDCSAWFPEIGEALAQLPGGPHVLDGEVCVLRSDGTSDFDLLQARARKRKPYPGGPIVTYCVFDLLALDGRLTMNLPLLERKRLLGELVADLPGVLFVKDLPADATFPGAPTALSSGFVGRVCWALRPTQSSSATRGAGSNSGSRPGRFSSRVELTQKPSATVHKLCVTSRADGA